MSFVGIASARIAILYADRSVQQQSINYGKYVALHPLLVIMMTSL